HPTTDRTIAAIALDFIRRHRSWRTPVTCLTWTWRTVSYTLSLHDALPISCYGTESKFQGKNDLSIYYGKWFYRRYNLPTIYRKRSEEHTSELQSRFDLVCRLLLEKKKKRLSVTGARAAILFGRPGHQAGYA